jgi:peptidyl-tRNA hydrolase, PTH1 family
MSISLVAGLGNPGAEYAKTRHNLGFIVLDAFAQKHGLPWKLQASFEAETARWEQSGRTVILAKPQTYMNESGRSVQKLAAFFKVPPDSIIAAYDDLNIDLGKVKVSVTGSAGGHNGVASLLEHLGDGFSRFRLGIGPKAPPQIELKDFVLGKFTPEQEDIVQKNLENYVSGLTLLIQQGPAKAMNQLNRRDLT